VNQEEQNVRAKKKEKRIEEVYLLRSKIKNGKPKQKKERRKYADIERTKELARNNGKKLTRNGTLAAEQTARGADETTIGWPRLASMWAERRHSNARALLSISRYITVVTQTPQSLYTYQVGANKTPHITINVWAGPLVAFGKEEEEDCN
jgi:hypothetical protein